MGFNVEFVDIGGGLGVDYDGTRSANSESSVNYSIQEYVNASISTPVSYTHLLHPMRIVKEKLFHGTCLKSWGWTLRRPSALYSTR